MILGKLWSFFRLFAGLSGGFSRVFLISFGFLLGFGVTT